MFVARANYAEFAVSSESLNQLKGDIYDPDCVYYFSRCVKSHRYRIRLGCVVRDALLEGAGRRTWTFLVTTIATSVTGYFFPVHKLLPSHVVGFISLITLALAWIARYRRQLAGGWRRTYVITAVIALSSKISLSWWCSSF